MNEKFGFLSNFPGFKMNLKKNLPHYVTPKRELTDNPSSRTRPNREFILTSDEDSDPEDERQKPRTKKKSLRPVQPLPAKLVINRILESGSSTVSKNIDDPDRTFCSELEAMSLRRSSSEPKLSSRKATSKIRETIIGSFSDEDEVCSRISEIHVSQKVNSQRKSKISDTVVGPFSEISDSNYKSTSAKRSHLPKLFLRDTIVQTSSEDEAEAPPFNLPKESLAETVMGFSDSMNEPSMGHEISLEPESSDDDEASKESDEVITILDSDEEDDVSTVNDDDQPPVMNSQDSFLNCSSVRSSESKTVETDNTLNKFFNNPPITSPENVISHSAIRMHKKTPKKSTTDRSADRFKVEADDGSESDPDLEIPETESEGEEIEVQRQPVDTEEDEEEEEVRTQSALVPSQPAEENDLVESEETVETQTTDGRPSNVYGTVNFSANINISLKISLRASSNSSESSSDSSSSSGDSQPPPQRKTSAKASKNTPKAKETPTRRARPSTKKKPDSTRKEKQASSTPGSGAKPIARPVEDFVTPTKPAEAFIDEDLQSVLDTLYGDSWKTPQLLRSVKSKTVQQNLRKSIHANNFESFVKSLPQGSERDAPLKENRKEVNSVKKVGPGSSSKKNATSSATKTPQIKFNRVPKLNVASTPTTPKYLEICDADTPSEETDSSSSDGSVDSDFNGDDTWNASSDEDVEEAERIKKRSIARKSRMDEQIIFLPDDTFDKEKKLDDLLDRYEYKKPPSIATPKAITKKKLFTHKHYEDEDDIVVPKEPVKVADKGKENDPDVLFIPPFPVGKKVQVPEIKVTPKKIAQPSPVTKKTPKVDRFMNNFSSYSFLKSLDCEANAALCDPEALAFRKNYKTRKTELAERLFKLYNENVFDRQLKDVPIKWNKKLLNTAGRCNNSRKGGIRQSQLELSDKVLTSADRLRCTLIHEMCHAVTWIVHGENGHGATWKRWAAKSNKTFTELPKINVCHDYVIEYRYAYVCSVCKAKYQAHSKSKKVEKIRCSICKGAIELFVNKKDKEGNSVMELVLAKEVRGFPKFVQLKYKNVKRPDMTHKEAMQLLSSEFKTLTVDQKRNL